MQGRYLPKTTTIKGGVHQTECHGVGYMYVALKFEACNERVWHLKMLVSLGVAQLDCQGAVLASLCSPLNGSLVGFTASLASRG